MKTRCLIIDDEPLAIEIISIYLANFSEIEVVGKCNNAIEAFEILKKSDIDLIFLDIQMPQITGIDFLKSLTNPPKVIFTTAFRDYACEGFDLNAVDYLLKPISFDRFLKAIDKYYETTNVKTSTPLLEEDSKVTKDDFIYIKADKKNIKVLFDEIYYIESLKDYVVFQLKDKKIITKNQISYYEKNLPSKLFLRCHRSFIIAIKKITAFNNLHIEILNKKLPIGRNYKQSILENLPNK